jgi:hypothetical protein
MVRVIAERVLESDGEEEGEGKEGEQEVISLARRCVELLDQSGDGKRSSNHDEVKRTLMEG